MSSSTLVVTIRAARRRARHRLFAISALALIIAVVAVGIGPVPLPPGDVLGVLGHHLWGLPLEERLAGTTDLIVWNTRVPRVAMAIVAGVGLAVAGTVMQALLRNDLADPYLLGLNSGASSTVAFAVLVAGGVTGVLLSGVALLGAVGAVLLAILLAGGARARGPLRIILAGLAVGYALNAVTSFLIFISDRPEAAQSVLFWLLGSLASIQPAVLLVAAIVTVVVVAILLRISPYLDAIASGDESALSAGLDPERSRLITLTVTSAMVGVIVAGVGGIGFVGLVIPHLARALVGTRLRIAIPASAALGAALLVIADSFARTALAPQEIPVGVVTGAIGAPFLIVLLRRQSTRSAGG
ncbi:MAG: FecCD family ABC transporter permease [Microbacterium sp.]